MKKKKRLPLFLFIDAFGWEVSRRHPDFLQGLITEHRPLDTVLGYSSACDPSIISGLPPSQHGLWTSYYYDPEHSPFAWTRPLRLLPEVIASERHLRNRLSRWVGKRCGITGYFQLYAIPFRQLHRFNYAEKKRIWEPGGLPHGTSIFDQLHRNGVPYYVHNSRLNDQERLDQLTSAIREQQIEFAYCSLGRLDALMHAEGNDSPQITPLLEWYDAQIRTIIETAQARYESVPLYVFTDHGMHNVNDTHDLMKEIRVLGLKEHRDYAAFYDATMARFWFMNATAKERITAWLGSHEKGRIVPEDELRKQGVFFENGQYGELIFLMASGTQIVPSYMGRKTCRGMHGFDPADADSKAQIMSSRPLPDELTHIRHIHGLMERKA